MSAAAWQVELVASEDLPEILALQKLAFEREARRANDFTIPPMVQTLEEIRLDFSRRTFLQARKHGVIIGTVRGHLDDAQICHVGRLCVHPTVQGQGLGTVLMHAIEATFARARGFEIFTGAASADVIRLYQRLG